MDMDDYDKECFDRIQRIAELEALNSKLLAERARLCTERNWECNEKLAAQMKLGGLEAEVERMENLLAEGIHTCNPTCKRPLCVLRREKRELEAELQTAHEIGARHAKRVGEQALELQALREAAQAHLHAIEHGSVEDEQDTADALAALLGGDGE